MRRPGLSPSLPTRLVCALSLLFIAACSQGSGDRCEVDGDCPSGLVCERPLGALDGTCRGKSTPPPFVPVQADAAVAVDAIRGVIDGPGAADAAVRSPDTNQPADARRVRDAMSIDVARVVDVARDLMSSADVARD